MNYIHSFLGGYNGLDKLKYLKDKLCNVFFNAALFRNQIAMPGDREREMFSR